VKKIPRKHAHFLYGAIQSGLTTGVSTAIANYYVVTDGSFLIIWAKLWSLSWLFMLPIVTFAAPAIRRLTLVLTRDD
jgi:hypothetical protein